MNKSLDAANRLIEKYLSDDKNITAIVLTKAGAEELQTMLAKVNPETMTSAWVIGAGLEIKIHHYMPDDCGGITIGGEDIYGRMKEGA